VLAGLQKRFQAPGRIELHYENRYGPLTGPLSLRHRVRRLGRSDWDAEGGTSQLSPSSEEPYGAASSGSCPDIVHLASSPFGDRVRRPQPHGEFDEPADRRSGPQRGGPHIDLGILEAEADEQRAGQEADVHAHAHAGTDTKPNTNIGTDTNANTDAGADRDTDPDTDSDTGTHAHAGANPDSDADTGARVQSIRSGGQLVFGADSLAGARHDDARPDLPQRTAHR